MTMSHFVGKSLCALALLAAAGVSGCATNAASPGELDTLRAQVQEAKKAAERAQATADAALSRAEEANNCCSATTEKIDRAFKKSQSK
jgi:alkanesulfonate monooxygenase SsuD/methylene tetrahydromethanopterin reductase-like flavin-dependent oxidoreductase (luciferase family)